MPEELQKAGKIIFKVKIIRNRRAITGGLAGCKKTEDPILISNAEKIDFLKKKYGISNPNQKEIDSVIKNMVYPVRFSERYVFPSDIPKCPLSKNIEKCSSIVPSSKPFQTAETAEEKTGVNKSSPVIPVKPKPLISLKMIKFNDDRVFLRVAGLEMDMESKIIIKTPKKYYGRVTVSDEQVEESNEISFKLEGLDSGEAVPLIVSINRQVARITVRKPD